MESRRMAAIVLVIVTFFIFVSETLNAQDKAQYTDTLVVDVNLFTPMVMEVDGYLVGHDIELWEAIAGELDLVFNYRQVSFNDMLDNIRRGRADVALGGITIKKDREEQFDFTVPYFNSGLSIAVVPQGTSLLGTIFALLDVVVKPFFAFMIYVVLLGMLLWVCDLGLPGVPKKFISGISEYAWLAYAIGTTIGFGDKTPQRPLGKFLSFLGAFPGFIIVGWVTAGIVTFQIQEVQSDISDSADLRGKVVATVRGTASVPTLRSLGATVALEESIEEAFEKLGQGEVDAVVHDTPAVLYYANNVGTDKVRVAGNPFSDQYYGIALQENSPLREDINRIVLKLQEFGWSRQLYEKYFGIAH